MNHLNQLYFLPIVLIFYPVSNLYSQTIETNNSYIFAPKSYLENHETQLTDSISSLINNLKNPDPNNREKAAELLGAYIPTNETIISNLISKFNDEDIFVSGKSIDAIVNIGELSIAYLINSLKDEEDDIRICSAIALGKIKGKNNKALPYLIEALSDSIADVRWCSAIAIGEFRDEGKSALSELIKLLYDNDKEVRWAAYCSIKKIYNDAIFSIKPDEKIIYRLNNIIPDLLKNFSVPGVSISIIKNNKLFWSNSFGNSDSNLQTKVNTNTIFEACSMSKPVFAFLVLKLVELGKLELDKPLSKYLTEQFISEDEKYSNEITARMVLTHTSGMPNWRKAESERGAPLPIYFKPGTKFHYSGEAIFYLQRVLEYITGEPLEKIAKKYLFDKLGLNLTSFVWNNELSPQIATGHNKSGNCNAKSKYRHANAAYTLYTTADDYAKFIIALMSKNKSGEYLLCESLRNEMLSHQIRVDVRDVIDRPGRALGVSAYRGLGWAIDSTITGNIAYHSGANQTGFRCYSQYNIKEGSGVVIMTNGANGSELWHKLINIIGDL